MIFLISRNLAGIMPIHSEINADGYLIEGFLIAGNFCDIIAAKELTKNVFDYDVFENMSHHLNEQKIFLDAEGN